MDHTQSSTESPAPDPQETRRAEILEAAAAVFGEKGFQRATMKDIAARAGIVPGTIYLYFRNKDDLLISIFEERVQRFIQQFQRRLILEENAEAKLRKLVELHLFEMQEHPDLAAVFQLELRQSRHFMSSYPKTDLKGYFDLIGQILEEGQQQGLFRKDLYLGAAKKAFFGAIDETVTSWLLAGQDYDLTHMAGPLADLFTRGLKE